MAYISDQLIDVLLIVESRLIRTNNNTLMLIKTNIGMEFLKLSTRLHTPENELLEHITAVVI